MKHVKFMILLSLLMTAVVSAKADPTDSWSDYRNTAWTGGTITSAADFAQFAYLVNNGTTFDNQTVTLGANVDLSAHEWVPIGTYNQFQGTFDGGKHTVSGLYIYKPSEYTQGLFGMVLEATIKDVRLIESTIVAANEAGGIVASLDNSKIENCHVDSSVTIRGDRSQYNAVIGNFGGVVGETRATYHSGSTGSQIIGCSSAAKIIYDGTYKEDLSGGFGGILGNTVYASGAPYPLVKNCFYYGTKPIGGNSNGEKNAKYYTGTIVGRVLGFGSSVLQQNFYIPNTRGQKANGNPSSAGSDDTNYPEGTHNGVPVYRVSGENVSFDCYSIYMAPGSNFIVKDTDLNSYGWDDFAYGVYNMSGHSESVGYVKFGDRQYGTEGTKFKLGYTGILPSGYSVSYTYDGTGASIGTEQYSGNDMFLTVGTSDVVVTARHSGIADGQGTEADPFVITTVDQWNYLCTSVNDGTETLSGKYVRLDADLEVSTMVGAPGESVEASHFFEGNFDGNGHTLTFTQGTAEKPYGEQYCAPFRLARNATFKRLNTKGTIYTSKDYAAGIVSIAYGDVKLTACRSDMTISSSYSGNATHGGLVAVLAYNVNIAAGEVTAGHATLTDCAFEGKLLTTNGSNGCGGLVGFLYVSNMDMRNCLYAPSEASSGMVKGTMVGNDLYGNVPNGTKATYDNCYYTTAATETNQGTPTSTSGKELALQLGEGWMNGTDGWSTNTVTSGKSVLPIITAQTLEGEGTETSPYLISNDDDWRKLAYMVNVEDSTFAGRYVKLNANNVTARYPVGTAETMFAGTFLGDNKTLTAAISNSDVEGAAPFRYIAGATIKQLTVSGTITGSRHPAAIVGFAWSGENTLEDCIATAIVNAKDYAGGLVGHGKSSTLNIKNSLFKGAITTTEATGESYVGGLLGWTDGSVLNITNSVFDGDITGITKSNAFNPIVVKNTASDSYDMSSNLSLALSTVPNSISTEARIPVAHTLATTNASDVSANGLYVKVALGGNSYYASLDDYGVNAQYEYTGSAIKPQPVVKTTADDIAFAKTTDYTLEYSASDDKSQGNYSVTIKAVDNSASVATLVGEKKLDYSVVATWDGTGTETDPYIIDNAAKLYQLAIRVNATTGGGYAFSADTYFKMTDDIEFEGSDITPQPIGRGYANSDQKCLFRGVFDGAGHVIRNFNVTSTDNCVGLFANNSGIIRNVAIQNSDISGNKYVGAIVGYNDGRVENCHVGNSVTVRTDDNGDDDSYHGGVVGYNAANNSDVPAGNKGVVYHCTSAASIQDAGSHGQHGGIVGANMYGGKVESCLFSGTTIQGGSDLAAIVGYNTGSVATSFYTNASYTGAAINNNDGTVSNVRAGLADDGPAAAFLNIYNELRSAINVEGYSDSFKAFAPDAITLVGRTLYKDGSWNTICLPFNVTLAGSPLAGAVAKTLADATVVGDHVTLTFGDDVTELQAGTPYIIKWDAAAENIVNPTFTGLTTVETAVADSKHISLADDHVKFCGYYGAFGITAQNSEVYYMTADNTLKHTGKARTLNACRAYFEFSEAAQAARTITLVFDDEATGISETVGVRTVGSSAATYNLQGQRLRVGELRSGMRVKQPAKGLFIVGGKKMLVK